MNLWYTFWEALPFEMLHWHFMQNALLALLLLAPRFGLVGVWAAMCAELCTRGALFLLRMARGKWLDKGALA